MVTTSPPLEDQVTRLLRGHREGDAAAGRALFELLYAELRGMAKRRLSNERADHTLAATSLVHEVFLRLDGARFDCRDREQFLALASTVMRRVLVDSARRRQTRRKLDPRDAHVGSAPAGGELDDERRDASVLRIDAALTRLARIDPGLQRVVELRFLVGLGVEETATALGVSSAKVKRDWRTARAFLHREIRRDDER